MTISPSLDPGNSFTETLFYGHEWSLFSLEVLLFTVVDLAAQNYVLAAVITFAVTQVRVDLSQLSKLLCKLQITY